MRISDWSSDVCSSDLGTRVITAREAARLHSIPDWVQLSKTKIWAYRQIGNSVPPLLGRAVARSIMNAAGLAPAAPVDVVPLGDEALLQDRKSTRLNSSHSCASRMPSSA